MSSQRTSSTTVQERQPVPCASQPTPPSPLPPPPDPYPQPPSPRPDPDFPAPPEPDIPSPLVHEPITALLGATWPTRPRG